MFCAYTIPIVVFPNVICRLLCLSTTYIHDCSQPNIVSFLISSSFSILQSVIPIAFMSLFRWKMLAFYYLLVLLLLLLVYVFSCFCSIALTLITICLLAEENNCAIITYALYLRKMSEWYGWLFVVWLLNFLTRLGFIFNLIKVSQNALFGPPSHTYTKERNISSEYFRLPFGFSYFILI